MIIEKIQALLTQRESNTLDFKLESYWDTASIIPIKACAFIIDLLSMANNPTRNVGYIVVGAKEQNGEVQGLQTVPFLDPSIIGAFLKDKVDHDFRWDVEYCEIKGERVALISVTPPLRQPVCLIRKFSVNPGNEILEGVIFSRRQASNRRLKPWEFNHDLESIQRSEATGFQPSGCGLGICTRWLEAFAAHDVEPSQIIRAFPELNVNALITNQSISTFLNGRRIIATCGLLHLNREWLETGRGFCQESINLGMSDDSFLMFLASRVANCEYVALHCIADTWKPSAEAEWHATFVVESHIPEFLELEVSQYVRMARLFWSTNSSRLSIFFDVLMMADRLKVPMYWWKADTLESLSQICDDEGFSVRWFRSGALFRNSEFHPEDLLLGNVRNSWNADDPDPRILKDIEQAITHHSLGEAR